MIRRGEEKEKVISARHERRGNGGKEEGEHQKRWECSAPARSRAGNYYKQREKDFKGEYQMERETTGKKRERKKGNDRREFGKRRTIARVSKKRHGHAKRTKEVHKRFLGSEFRGSPHEEH